VGREYIKLSGITSVARARPLSMKIISPKAINWTLKQYGYISSNLYFIKQDYQIATIDIQKV
jgi:hypothetical protein